MTTTPPQGDDEAAAEVAAGRSRLQKIRQDTTARWGLYIVVVTSACALLAMIDAHLSFLTGGMLSDFTFAQTVPVLEHPERAPPPSEMQAYLPPAFLDGGTWAHPLGTDQLGRDYLSRIVYGSRISMSVGFVATLVGVVGGVTLGSTAGYYGGWVDDVLMRFAETVYAIPALVLVIVFTMFVSGGSPDIQYAVIGVGITSIPIFARIIRSRVFSVREMDYVMAARAAGVKDRHIILRHVVPNSFAPVLVLATLQIGVVVLIVAGLSFLGYGAQPPTPDWGQMLNLAQGRMHSNPWMSLWPGLAILITIMGFNLLGDGLQDALDPRIED